MPSPTEFPPDAPRCAWCLESDAMRAYHDLEWGRPLHGDTRAVEAALFEKLSLEAFQSGLAWRTILAKRDGFRAAFVGFDVERVAGFAEADVARLLTNAGIVRHRGKIEATVQNARALRALRDTTSFSALVWSHAPGRSTPSGADGATPNAKGPAREAVALAKALAKHGFRFVGPTTVYAFMQAVGVVNDHTDACVARAACEAEREALR